MFNNVDVLHPLHDTPNEKFVYNVKAGRLISVRLWFVLHCITSQLLLFVIELPYIWIDFYHIFKMVGLYVKVSDRRNCFLPLAVFFKICRLVRNEFGHSVMINIQKLVCNKQ